MSMGEIATSSTRLACSPSTRLNEWICFTALSKVIEHTLARL